MHKFIHQIQEMRQAIFVGFFGPIGVSAIFYLYITLEFLETITVDGVQRADAQRLGEVLTVVVWFLAICSIVSLTAIIEACADIFRSFTVSAFPWVNLDSSSRELCPDS